MNNLQQLLIEFKSKNYDNFDYFYDETKKLVYLMISSTIKNEETINDLIQDVYVKFLNSIDKISINDNAVAYLAQIAKNTAINEYHKNKRISYDEEYIKSLKDTNETSTSRIDLGIIDFLQPEEREIVYLHIVSNLKFREIAHIVNKPLGTVLWKYNKAIKYLRKKVGEIDEN